MSEGLGGHDAFGRVESWDDGQGERWAAALELRASAADQVRLREEIVRAVDVPVGGTVVEIGCGTGPLLELLADAVGPGGRAIGIEPQPVLARFAQERLGDRVEVRVERGSETELPDGIADACVAQTVLCHVPSPEREQTLARMVRLTRAGGRVLSADQDAETWVVDHPDRGLTRRIVTFYADQRFADGWTGRRLRGLFLDAGLVDVRTQVSVTVETGAESYGFRIAVDRAGSAARAGAIGEDELAAWAATLEQLAAAGRFFSSLNYYVTAGNVSDALGGMPTDDSRLA